MQEGKSRARAFSRECSERFVFQNRLGAGSSGCVYRAFDKARQATLAVKVLNEVEPASLYRFKGEFRALTGIVHANLVQLYDLLTLEGDWLLTMELVEGCDFLRYVRPLRTPDGYTVPPPANDADEATLTVYPDSGALHWQEAIGAAVSGWKAARKPPEQHASREGVHAPAPVTNAIVRVADLPLDEGRLRSALRQLCEGLQALHRANRLHRDLKPANVLVHDRDGRLVICDFGLVTHGTALPEADPQEDGVGIAGTLSYMSPEQATGQALTEASDWYAVGVMLYQALTGAQPYLGCRSVAELIASKQAGKVVHPCSVAAEAPEDLAALAVDLLAGDPAARPGYEEIVSRLDGARASPSFGPSAPQRLIGREVQLAQLRAAFARTRAGSATLAMVAGRSGMGKSSLVQHFLAELRERERAVVLSGRCYEHEELPYKAFDPLMDALSAYLMQLDDGTMRELSPPHVASLARLFPVLRRVPAIAEAMRGEALHALEEKRRAFAAFRELCRRIALRRPLVLYIDDLQWGDLDSGLLFHELLHPPQPPAVLLICAYRSEDEDVSPLLKALRKTHLPESGTVPLEVRIEALRQEDSEALAQTVLGNGDESAAERIAYEAAGSPFFVRELALYWRAHGGLSEGQLRLESLIADRLARLPGPARALFSVIAVAGRPERLALLQTAAKLGEQGMNALRTLEAQHLVHCTGARLHDRVQVYHDRLRETACRLLQDNEQRLVHRALAEALEKSEERDPEALFEHWRECGEPHKAGECAREAAQNAEGLFAFERAARLYRAALDLLPLADEELRALEERLGHALMLSGRGVEAAEAFSRALVGASPAHAMRLRNLATTQLLRSGRIERAFDELKRAKASIGLAVPTTNLRALWMLAWRRLKIRFTRIRLRSQRPAAKELFERVDMLWAVSASLACVDPLRGAVYQAEHILVALRANDAYRMACAVAVEAAMSALDNRDPGRTQRLIDRGLELAGISGEPHALSVVKGIAAVCRYLEGRFRESARLSREAQEVLRERLNATLAWDLVSMVIYDLMSEAMLGNVRELVERVPEVLRDAEGRGDLYAATACRTTRFVWAWLGPDRPDVARRQVELAENQWQQTGYQMQHWFLTFAHAEVGLYSDAPEPVLARIESEWRELFFIRTVQCTRIETANVRGRLRLACARRCAADDPSAAAAWVSGARRDAELILREHTAWGFALGRLLLAGADAFDDREAARKLLREVEGQFDALDMRLHQQVARYRRGQLTIGAEGELLRESAAGAMRALGVAQPAGFVRMLAPGFPGLDPG